MADARRTVEVVWRIESPRVIASLTRLVRDVGLAEELAQDAFVAALEQWPTHGVPDKPGAWLMTTARRRAIDVVRRERNRDAKYAVLVRELTDEVPADGIVEDPVGDDLLSLVFLTCHPVLPKESRIALTLRLFGGLTTDEIARAYLTPSPTIGQRISRAKRTLAEAHVPFEIPQADEMPSRIGSVLEVVYLIFTEGYAATSGDDWVRRDLADEAMRLGRVLAGLLPREPEVHGLVALMELQASRFDARGAGTLLQDQDRRFWDRALIEHGLRALEAAIALRRPLGPYTVQAAIAACHSRAPSFESTDWEAVVALYDALAQLAPSPVVGLNRAVAVLHADGPRAALDALDAIAGDPRMARYHLFGAVRAEVLSQLGRPDEAAAELERAADLAPTQRERNLLLERAAAAVAD
ncbi:RNA polymerase sigma factor [Cellulomonas sp. URHD0024]|uniref:RNA polymerase sigma factor n=1 Tax=Cellulomonas sp. URHD0024 TaxID=1302620 RepID=UPI0004197AEF|nr:RNA polymerase sigma factor [Cellulomonas sp. URHD0024]